MSHKIKLINQISSDLVIEDIGIKLIGKGDFRIVDFEIASRSKDLIRMSGLVKQEKIPMPKIWPFISNPPPPSPPIPVPIQKSVPVQVVIHDDQTKAISDLSKKMNAILQLLAERPNQPTIINQISNPTVSSGQSSFQKKSDDPMFIPSKIIPDGAETKINVKSDEVQKDDMDSISKKLSSLLKPKK